jgi:hypothetical protein
LARIENDQSCAPAPIRKKSAPGSTGMVSRPLPWRATTVFMSASKVERARIVADPSRAMKNSSTARGMAAMVAAPSQGMVAQASMSRSDMVKVSFFLPTSSRAWSRISMLREPPGMLRMAFAASAKAATENF